MWRNDMCRNDIGGSPVRTRFILATLTAAAAFALAPGVAHAAVDADGTSPVAEDGAAVVTAVEEPTAEGVAPPTEEPVVVVLPDVVVPDGGLAAVSGPADDTVVDGAIVLEGTVDDGQPVTISAPVGDGEPVVISAPVSDGEPVTISAPVEGDDADLIPFVALAGVAALGAGAVVLVRQRQSAGAALG
jgi:hypothetical protein